MDKELNEKEGSALHKALRADTRLVSAFFSNELLVNFGFNNNEIKIIKDICSNESIKPLSLFRQALREWQFKHTGIEPVESKGCMGD